MIRFGSAHIVLHFLGCDVVHDARLKQPGIVANSCKCKTTKHMIKHRNQKKDHCKFAKTMPKYAQIMQIPMKKTCNIDVMSKGRGHNFSRARAATMHQDRWGEWPSTNHAKHHFASFWQKFLVPRGQVKGRVCGNRPPDANEYVSAQKKWLQLHWVLDAWGQA